jgi:signal transduction histidine kinase
MDGLPSGPHTGDAGSNGGIPLVPLLATLREAVFVVDASDCVVLWTPNAERLLETPAATAVGQRFRDLDVSYRIPGLYAALDRARRQRDRVEVPEAEVVARDGSARFIAAVVAPIADGDRGAGWMALVLRDETESARMRAEHAVVSDELKASSHMIESTLEELQVTNEELRTANDELEARVADLEAAQETDRNKNEFLAMLAHELRNPLAAITSAMRVFRHHALREPELQHAHEIVERQIKHQARLLDDLLDVSRITRGKIDLRRTRADLAALVRESVDGMQGLFDARQISLSVKVPAATVTVDADPTRLIQIVGNLLSNAAKYTPAGGAVDVSLSTVAGEAVLSVRDSGIGIPTAMLPRVFDLFMQVNPSLARSEGGLGIGLTLVRTLAELHGGSVAAHSAGPGRGSEFVVRLPSPAPWRLPSERRRRCPTPRGGC